MAVLSSTTVEKDGGYRIVVTGLVVANGKYIFHVGALGTAADAAAYAGAYGKGNIATVTNGASSFVTPPLAQGGPYNIFVEPAPGNPAGSELIAAALTYVHKNYRSGVYSVRAKLPPLYRGGPPSIEAESPQGW